MLVLTFFFFLNVFVDVLNSFLILFGINLTHILLPAFRSGGLSSPSQLLYM